MDFVFNAKIWAWFLILKLKDILQNWPQVELKTAKKLLNCDDGLNGHGGGGQNGVGTRRRQLPRQNWRRRQQRRRQKRM